MVSRMQLISQSVNNKYLYIIIISPFNLFFIKRASYSTNKINKRRNLNFYYFMDLIKRINKIPNIKPNWYNLLSSFFNKHGFPILIKTNNYKIA